MSDFCAAQAVDLLDRLCTCELAPHDTDQMHQDGLVFWNDTPEDAGVLRAENRKLREALREMARRSVENRQDALHWEARYDWLLRECGGVSPG